LTAIETASVDTSAPSTGFAAIFDSAMMTAYAAAAPRRLRQRGRLALMPSAATHWPPIASRSIFDPLNQGF
jgi:hypothetical protein